MITVKLQESQPEELQYFGDIEADVDTRDHITPYSPQQHQSEFASINSVYLSICADSELVGFFILALETDNQSAGFRRIVIARKGGWYRPGSDSRAGSLMHRSAAAPANLARCFRIQSARQAGLCEARISAV